MPQRRQIYPKGASLIYVYMYTCIPVYMYICIYVYGCCPKFLVPEVANFTRKTFPFAKLSRNHCRA